MSHTSPKCNFPHITATLRSFTCALVLRNFEQPRHFFSLPSKSGNHPCSVCGRCSFSSFNVTFFKFKLNYSVKVTCTHWLLSATAYLSCMVTFSWFPQQMPESQSSPTFGGSLWLHDVSVTRHTAVSSIYQALESLLKKINDPQSQGFFQIISEYPGGLISGVFQTCSLNIHLT